MRQNIKNRNKGFTIIEVLIVLAIAGLILLVVFLAVPALQRNSRNTQRKNEVANILSAVNEYANNNGGTNPTSANFDEAIDNAKLGFYSASSISLVTSGSNASNTETVQIRTGAKCGTDGNSVPGSSRQIVAMYTVETGGGDKKQEICQES